MGELIADLEAAIRARHLSMHPFYEAWNEGRVPVDALRAYARQYFIFVSTFPRLVSRVHSNAADEADRLLILENLNEEENPDLPHTALWRQFAEGIGVSEIGADPLPETRRAIETLWGLTNDDLIAGCAALLAYEAQISDIAILKKRGLEQHYGISDSRTLAFFDEHAVADIEHQKTWKRILEKRATSPEQRETARHALQAALDAQWLLLDGVKRAYC